MDIINKYLIGYIIKHPEENIGEVLSNILLNEDIYSFFYNNTNFFEINEELQLITKKEIIEILFKEWTSLLDDYDYFSFSKNYVIFIKDKIVNIVGHIDIDDLKNIKSEMINKIKNKDEMHALIYPIYAPGNYTIDDVEIEINKVGEIKANSDEVEYGKIDENDILYKTNRQNIYFLTKKYLKEEKLKKEELKKIIKILSYEYAKTIDINKVLKNNGFKIFKTFQEVTNLNSAKLQDKASGKLLQGKIDLSVDRGYQTHPERPQQDSALSIVKNKDIFLNVIADGAGGSENGGKAGTKLVSSLKEWFELLPDELFYEIGIIEKLLKQKIIEIDKTIEKKYKKSYTTFVLSLTIYDKTIIANIGDSQAYTYINDKLMQLTTLDSDSNGMSYEDTRLNPWNNMITAAVGDGYVKDIHINVINNEGQKIILSSDGITDLISEERFKSYFIKDIDSSQMIEDALSKEDTEWLNKKEDNISVIVIKLPNYSQKKLVK